MSCFATTVIRGKCNEYFHFIFSIFTHTNTNRLFIAGLLVIFSSAVVLGARFRCDGGAGCSRRHRGPARGYRDIEDDGRLDSPPVVRAIPKTLAKFANFKTTCDDILAGVRELTRPKATDRIRDNNTIPIK